MPAKFKLVSADSLESLGYGDPEGLERFVSELKGQPTLVKGRDAGVMVDAYVEDGWIVVEVELDPSNPMDLWELDDQGVAFGVTDA